MSQTFMRLYCYADRLQGRNAVVIKTDIKCGYDTQPSDSET